MGFSQLLKILLRFAHLSLLPFAVNELRGENRVLLSGHHRLGHHSCFMMSLQQALGMLSGLLHGMSFHLSGLLNHSLATPCFKILHI